MGRRSWKRELPMKLLGSSVDTAIVKLLLADLVGPDGDPLEAYRQFISTTVNIKLSTKTIAGLGGQNLAQFFKADFPTENPMFLNFEETRHLAQLDLMFGVRMVVARAPGNTDATNWVRVYDSRIYDHARPLAGGDPPIVFYVVELIRSTKDVKQWLLFRYEGCADSQFLDLLDVPAENFIVRSRLEPLSPTSRCWNDGRCLADRIRLELEAGEEGTSSVLRHHYHEDHDERCTTLSGFLRNGTDAYRAVGRPFILASHLGTELLSRRSMEPRHQFFCRLLTGYDRALPRPPAAEMCVVLVDARGGFYLPHSAHAAVIRYPRLTGRRVQPKHESLPGMEHPGMRQTGKTQVPITAVPTGFTGDCCNPCSNAGVYETNLGIGGRQRLYKMSLSPKDALQLLGLDSPDHLALVTQASRLSCCSYDIESCTSNTKCEAAQADLNLDFVRLGDTALPRVVVGVQYPVFVGVTDTIDLDAGVDPEILSCAAGDYDSLVVSFTDSVIARRVRAVAAKTTILAPLLALTDGLEAAFFKFFEGEEQSGRLFAYDVCDDDISSELSGDSFSTVTAEEEEEDEDEDEEEKTVPQEEREDSETSDEDSYQNSSWAWLFRLTDKKMAAAKTRVRGRRGGGATYKRVQNAGVQAHRRAWGGGSRGSRRRGARGFRRRGRAREAARTRDQEVEERRNQQDLQLKAAWRNTIFGQLQRSLVSLANKFIVFGFNCEVS
jgi:hypothetical protein